MKAKKIITNNQGATSVLIMVMMIILMVFGLAALTTSAASKKLANKNATWLKEYYALQGQAEIVYAELVDRLALQEENQTVNRIETSLLAFLKNRSNIRFEKTGEQNRPFLIEIIVKEEGKEVAKNIQMVFSVIKKDEQFFLQTEKWLQQQSEIFSEEDELHFSDVKIE